MPFSPRALGLMIAGAGRERDSVASPPLHGVCCTQVSGWLDRWHSDRGRLARASSLRRCDHVDPVKIGLVGYGRYAVAPVITVSEASRLRFERHTMHGLGAEL